jgi:hypothetical protein
MHPNHCSELPTDAENRMKLRECEQNIPFLIFSSWTPPGPLRPRSRSMYFISWFSLESHQKAAPLHHSFHHTYHIGISRKFSRRGLELDGKRISLFVSC